MKTANKNLPLYTLGLDIGIASVGAALLGEQRILGLHVRTFDKAEANDGQSLNAIRRNARLTRRRIRRRRHRMLRLCRLFRRQGLIAEARPQAFKLPATTPWELRAQGLDRCLTAQEWASVLYHIVKHRGFQSNRKSEASADEKAGQMLSGVSFNQQRLQTSGMRTIGELAARHPDFTLSKRNKRDEYSHTFGRTDLEHEIGVLFERQRAVGSPHADQVFERAVRDLLHTRKPTLSGENLLKMIGKCTFEPQERRAPKATYSAERFIWQGKLNNLKIEESGATRALSEQERQIAQDLPFTKAKLTFMQLRKALELPESARFNLVRYAPNAKGKDPEEATLFEAKAFHALRKAYENAGLKAEWQRDSLDAQHLDTLGYALTCFKDDDEIRAHLMQQGIETAIVDAVLSVHFAQFINLSLKALRNILPFMEQGERYDQAAESAGYSHYQPRQAVKTRGYLPAPDREEIRNPVVYRALNQARKLVNAIVREYGPPMAVHIEMARDLNKPFKERQQIMRDQEEYQAAKQQAHDDFVELFGFEPRSLDLQKRRLYEEQGGKCAYSLQPLDSDRLCEDDYVEADHILPYSRSFDNSLSNKVLVLTGPNRDKGNRTPYEYFGADEERWHRFEVWVGSSPGLRQGKRMRLLRKHFGDEEAKEFRKRNLTDTRSICRTFKAMLETHLRWHPDAEGDERCVVVAGQLTSLLRARWGLVKVRTDGDLHHALDAAVVAATSSSLVKRMADYSRRRELERVRASYVDFETGEVLDRAALRQLEEHFPQPWEHFWREVNGWLSANPAQALEGLPQYPDEQLQAIKPIRVSRAPTRHGLGAAHQETIRSIGRQGALMEQGQSSVKTPVKDLTLEDLPNIVGADDPRNADLVRVLRERLEAFGGNGETAFAANQPRIYKPSAPEKKAPEIRSVKLLSTQKSGLLVRGGIAKNGDMLRADIFTKGGKFYAVPLYVADTTQAELPNRAIVASKDEDEWLEMDQSYLFLFSLYPNDWVRITLKSEIREGYYAGVHRGTGAISYWAHDRNQSVGKKGLFEGNGIQRAVSVDKFHVDLLGHLHKAAQEARQPLLMKKSERRS